MRAYSKPWLRFGSCYGARLGLFPVKTLTLTRLAQTLFAREVSKNQKTLVNISRGSALRPHFVAKI
jgi:hypothetical protein